MRPHAAYVSARTRSLFERQAFVAYWFLRRRSHRALLAPAGGQGEIEEIDVGGKTMMQVKKLKTAKQATAKERVAAGREAREREALEEQARLKMQLLELAGLRQELQTLYEKTHAELQASRAEAALEAWEWREIEHEVWAARFAEASMYQDTWSPPSGWSDDALLPTRWRGGGGQKQHKEELDNTHTIVLIWSRRVDGE
mgnify:CR=1 FL=1